VPVLPVCLIEPVWVQFLALSPQCPTVAPTHPLGCRRQRIPDRVVFEQVLVAVVHGTGYERMGSPVCSDCMTRRPGGWADLGLAEHVHTLALQAYDRMIGLDLEDLSAVGCITKASAGGELAGRSPVDRGQAGGKSPVVTDGNGFPLHLVSAGANRNDARCWPRPWRDWSNLTGCPRI
jgi:hypothetical protein